MNGNEFFSNQIQTMRHCLAMNSSMHERESARVGRHVYQRNLPCALIRLSHPSLLQNIEKSLLQEVE
jgi:hypothetical protein